MIELKTKYIIEFKDTITNIVYGYRMPLGVNHGAIRFTNDPEKAMFFDEIEDVKKEINHVKTYFPDVTETIYEVTRTAYEIWI